MSQSVDTLTSWMDTNRLLLNPSKILAIWLGGQKQLAKTDFQRLSSLFRHITFSTSVRDLGVMLDLDSGAHVFASYRFGCMPESATISYASFIWFPVLLPIPIETHPRPRICNYSRIDCSCSLLAGLPLESWTEFCARMPVMLGDCPSFLPSLITFVMTCSTSTAYLSMVR